MSPISDTPFTLRRIIIAGGIAILATLLTLYITYQARSFLRGPSIELFGAYQPLQSERIIVLDGSAQNIVALQLNGKEIHTSPDGTFSQQLVLGTGYTEVTLQAEDRFGRVTRIIRPYVFVPTTDAPGAV